MMYININTPKPWEQFEATPFNRFPKSYFRTAGVKKVHLEHYSSTLTQTGRPHSPVTCVLAHSNLKSRPSTY